MRNFWAVYIRELKSYFTSPIFYIIGTVFMLIVGNTFKDSFFSFATATMRMLRNMVNYGGNVDLMNVNMVMVNTMTFINFLFLLIVPLLTMRLYAEEKKNGTMELLLTSPITTTQVLLGKFFSCLTIYFFLMALTLSFNIILMIYSKGKLDYGQMMCAYLGSLLFGATLISIGMFFSSLTENQIVAAAVTISVLMGIWMMMYTANFLNPPFNLFVTHLSMPAHLDKFVSGILGIEDIAYFTSMTLFWLFLTGMTVESVRWRQ